MADERKPVRFRLRRHHEDPAASADPRVAGVLDQLSTARERATQTAPDAEFRAELRAQLVAITPRIVAESAAENATEVAASKAPQGVPVLDRPRPARPAPGPRPAPHRPATPAPMPRRSLRAALGSFPLARPLAVAASIVTLLALVLGGAVWMSQDAVPGDTLYGLKRTSEDVRLSFADTDAERAADKLEFAQTRVEEARTLVGRTSATASGPQAAGRVSPETAALVTSALRSADADTREATSLLGAEAVKAASANPLSDITTWVPAQLQRLRELRAAAPTDTLVTTATAQSMALLQSARTRAAALAKRVDCNCLQGGPSDGFGPLPVPVTPTAPTTPGAPSTAPGSTASAPAPSRPSTRPSPGRPGTTSERPAAPPSSKPGTTPPLIQLPTLPSRPTYTPSPGDLCKINVLGIRLCPTTPS